ncbi:MAG: hypothetical protein ABW003_03205 [Microvirga sp.]
MAQIWLTFDELAAHAECSVPVARAEVTANNWRCRQSSDGQTRVKLPPELAHAYMLAYAQHHGAAPSNVGDMLESLRGALEQAGLLSGVQGSQARPRTADSGDGRAGQKGLLRRAS